MHCTWYTNVSHALHAIFAAIIDILFLLRFDAAAFLRHLYSAIVTHTLTLPHIVIRHIAPDITPYFHYFIY